MNITQIALLIVCCFAYAHTTKSMEAFTMHQRNAHAQTKPLDIPSRITQHHENPMYFDSPCGSGRSTTPNSYENSPAGTPPHTYHGNDCSVHLP